MSDTSPVPPTSPPTRVTSPLDSPQKLDSVTPVSQAPEPRQPEQPEQPPQAQTQPPIEFQPVSVPHPSPVLSPVHNPSTSPSPSPSPSRDQPPKKDSSLLLDDARGDIEDERRRLRALNLAPQMENARKAVANSTARLASASSAAQALLEGCLTRVKAYEVFCERMAVPPTQPVAGSLDKTVDYVQRITRTEIESAMGFCRAISHDVVPALRNSITEMVTLQQKILKKSGGLLATLEVYFERVLKSQQELEIASDALPQDVAPLTRKDAPQQTHLRKDPWLAVAATIHATNMFSLAMSQFSVAMSAIKQEAEVTEANHVALVKSTVEQLIALHKIHLGKVLTDIGIAAQMTTQHVTESAESKQQPKLEQLTSPQKVALQTSHLVHGSVIKEGELECSGMFSWRKYNFVLTRYGFLHYFTSLQNPIPDESIPLHMCRMTFSAPSRNCFQLEWSSPGLFGASTKSYQLRASDAAVAAEWILHLQHYT